MTEEQEVKESLRPVDSIEDSGKALATAVIDLTFARVRGNSANIKSSLAKLTLELNRAIKATYSNQTFIGLLAVGIENDQSKKAEF